MNFATCYIIPPAYLKMVLEEGNEEEQEWAMHTLMVSERLRGQREIIGSSPSMFAESAGKKTFVNACISRFFFYPFKETIASIWR
jgi:hypothetical protein